MASQLKPRVYLIGTGGSISSVGDYRTDYINYSYGNQHLTIHEMLDRVPEVQQFAEVLPEQLINVGSTEVGPQHWLQARITNDNGDLLPTNEIGNLQVRGPNVFVGYWKMPDKTAEDFTEDGFFDTGDQGRIDEDGYISIVGRARDMVITGGLNVYPKEVELFIDGLPGVKESAVIGVPHPDFGEAVVAVVVLDDGAKPGEDDLLLAAKEHLANYKVPKRVVFLDELPRNSMAKVQKLILRETYQNLFA